MDLEEYRHPDAGFSLPLPPRWERIESPHVGIALVTVEPVNEVEFRANAVVSMETLADGQDLEQWQTYADEQLLQHLPNFTLIDWEPTEIDDREFVRRLAHYVGDDTGSVTMEQWATIADYVGYTLTTSVGTLSYDSLADTFADMALRLRIDGHGNDPREAP